MLNKEFYVPISMQALAKYSFYVKCFQRHRMLAHHFLKTPMGVLLHSEKHAEAFNNVYIDIITFMRHFSHIYRYM